MRRLPRRYASRNDVYGGGFTLIETIIIVGVLGVIMITVTGVLINSFRVKTRLEVADLVEENGTMVLRQIRDNVILSTGVGITCAVNVVDVGSTLSILNTVDGMVTNLVCYEGSKIASVSASGSFDLTSSSVRVTGCNNFARCELFPDTLDRINKVNFNFTLSAGDTGSGQEGLRSRGFSSTIVPRN